MAAPGTGCHQAILGTATLGIMAGEDPAAIHQAIANAIPPGARSVPAREIQEAITRALSDTRPLDGTAVHRTYTPRPLPTPPAKDMTAARQKIIEAGRIKTEVDLWEASPLRLWDDPIKDSILLLESIYSPDDHLFIGTRYDGTSVKPVSKWIEFFHQGGKPAPHFCINPLSGQPVQTGDKETWRGDANVVDFRYILVEFDSISIADQIAFWSGSGLPVCCLIDSGGKSIHGLLDVSMMAKVESLDQWRSEIKGKLFDDILTPLGADGASSNPARLSRMPGHNRDGKRMQKILWLAGREGKEIA